MSQTTFRRSIPLVAAGGLFMENLDSTVISTALPQIAISLGESPAHLSTAMTVYMLALAAFLPVGGWAADRYGARNVFAGAILIFTVGSILCALSNTYWALVGARAIQGMGGAMMTPVGRLAILKTVPKSDLIRAMALFTMPALIGPAAGPLVGGAIVTYWSWHGIFLINIPIGLVGFILTLRLFPDLREEDPAPFDGVGALLAGLSLMGLVMGLENIGRGALPPLVIGAIIGGSIAAGVLYLLHARRIERPALDLDMFKNRTFSAGILSGLLFRMGIGAVPFLMPMLLQVAFGLSALNSGMLTFVGAVGAMSMKALAPGLYRRFGFRSLLIRNAALAGVFLATYGLFRPGTPHWVIFVLLLVSGFFRSLQFTGVNTLAYSDIPKGRAGGASTVSAVAQQLGLSLGVAIGATVLAITTAAAGGGAPTAVEFAPAFIVIGVLASLSVVPLLRLPRDAGREVSGHRVEAQTSDVDDNR